MKTFKIQAAQGDTFFEKVKAIPRTAKLAKKTSGPVVVAHSETGHHHVFRDPTGIKLYETKDPFVCYLRMESPALLEHLREFDTHEAIKFDAGCYRIRRQREHTPEGFRMVAD